VVARRASTVTGYSHTSPSFTIKRRKLTSLLLTKQRSDLGVILGTPKEFSLRQLCMAVLWRQFETPFFPASVMASFTSIMAAHLKSFLRVSYTCDKAREQSALGLRHKIAQVCRSTCPSLFLTPALALRTWAGINTNVFMPTI